MFEENPICKLLNIKYPIFQGGMAWIGTAELASAVSNAGGLGIIGAGHMPPDLLRAEIQKAKRWTDKPFGVNIMLMSPFVKEVMQVVIDERVAVVTTGAGNPAEYLPALKEVGTKVIPVVASVALAKRLVRSGVDAVIAEGTESGGHIGDITTMALVPQVVDAVNIPVIAAGGIADARGFAAALMLGASGVQMGTQEYEIEMNSTMELLPKQQINIVVETSKVDKILDIIKKELYTGHIGDGKIFISPVSNVIRVRTGEEGMDALK